VQFAASRPLAHTKTVSSVLSFQNCYRHLHGFNFGGYMTMLEQTPERVIGYFQDRHVKYAA
jgi:hypothetical protein